MSTTFRIYLPLRLTGFAADSEIESSSAGWSNIRSGDGSWRAGTVVRIPDGMFQQDRRVEEAKVYRIHLGLSLVPEEGKPQPGGVALLLESPHWDEFDGRRGRANGPLRNPIARKALQQHLPSLLAEVARRLDRPLEGITVTLVNAVQYQTSLQALMSQYDGKLTAGVRTPVWRTVFDNGGDRDLLARLDSYDPAIVLTAPTGAVRAVVERAIEQHERTWPWLRINCHPSYWARCAPRIVGVLHPATGTSVAGA